MTMSQMVGKKKIANCLLGGGGGPAEFLIGGGAPGLTLGGAAGGLPEIEH